MTMTHTESNGTLRKLFNDTPLYMQVKDEVKSRIAAGAYQSVIPNEGDLAREFGISPGTTRKALDALEAEGIVDRKQGRGTYVRELVPWQKLSPDAAAFLGLLPGQYVPSDPAERAVLQIVDNELTANRITADELRVLARGAAEIAAWLDLRAAKMSAKAEEAA